MRLEDCHVAKFFQILGISEDEFGIEAVTSCKQKIRNERTELEDPEAIKIFALREFLLALKNFALREFLFALGECVYATNEELEKIGKTKIQNLTEQVIEVAEPPSKKLGKKCDWLDPLIWLEKINKKNPNRTNLENRIILMQMIRAIDTQNKAIAEAAKTTTQD